MCSIEDDHNTIIQNSFDTYYRYFFIMWVMYLYVNHCHTNIKYLLKNGFSTSLKPEEIFEDYTVFSDSDDEYDDDDDVKTIDNINYSDFHLNSIEQLNNDLKTLRKRFKKNRKKMRKEFKNEIKQLKQKMKKDKKKKNKEEKEKKKNDENDDDKVFVMPY